MKKLLCIVLTLVLIVSLGSICFAENVDNSTYDEKSNKIIEKDLVSSVDEAVPSGSSLPRTGGVPAEAFYAVGALLIVGALVISKKKPKPASKS